MSKKSRDKRRRAKKRREAQTATSLVAGLYTDQVFRETSRFFEQQRRAFRVTLAYSSQDLMWVGGMDWAAGPDNAVVGGERCRQCGKYGCPFWNNEAYRAAWLAFNGYNTNTPTGRDLAEHGGSITVHPETKLLTSGESNAQS